MKIGEHMNTHEAASGVPGIYGATPEAQAVIAFIEDELNSWYKGGDVDFTDVVDKALSLAGLMVTVDSFANRACIQAR